MIDSHQRMECIEKAIFGGPNPDGASVISQPAVVRPVVYAGPADVLAYPGRAILTGRTAATLPTPQPGIDDGKTLTIFNAMAFRNTVTTEPGKIVNGRVAAQ